jgi:hypothetical protein
MQDKRKAKSCPRGLNHRLRPPRVTFLPIRRMAAKVGYWGLHDRELRVIMRITRTRQYSQILINTRYFPLYLLDVAPCCPLWCAELLPIYPLNVTLFSPSCSRQLAQYKYNFPRGRHGDRDIWNRRYGSSWPIARFCCSAKILFAHHGLVHVYGVP